MRSGALISLCGCPITIWSMVAAGPCNSLHAYRDTSLLAAVIHGGDRSIAFALNGDGVPDQPVAIGSDGREELWATTISQLHELIL